MRKWQLMTTALDPRHDAPLFMQLADVIASDIRDGRLHPGDALPGSRVLAQQLGVHRSTVLAGYRELRAQGVVYTRSGGGTFVAERRSRAPAAAPVAAPPRSANYPLGPLIAPPPMVPPDPPGAFMMFRGVPDVRMLPAEALARAFRRGLARHGRKLLSYADPRGHERLRDELATMLSHTRGLAVTSDSLMVTRGSQQALFLVAQALLAPGDVVAVEALGNPAVWSALRHTGAELISLPVDDEGLDIDAVEALVKRQPLRAVYVTPHHQFPTNTVMPAARRARLAALSLDHHFAIFEDDYDHEFHYEGKPMAPIAAGAAGISGANVIYLGSLSKVLAPGLRIGYVVAPPEVLTRLASLRAVCDMQGDAVVECAVAELFEDGELLRHVYKMRETYGRRRDALSAALACQLGDTLTFTIPDGGMAIWARVADRVDVAAWSRAGEQLGVLFRGAGMFDFEGRDIPFLRLGFTYHDEEELREATELMARALGPRRSSAPWSSETRPRSSRGSC